MAPVSLLSDCVGGSVGLHPRLAGGRPQSCADTLTGATALLSDVELCSDLIELSI